MPNAKAGPRVFAIAGVLVLLSLSGCFRPQQSPDPTVLNRSLLAAAASGNAGSVEQMLKQGAKIDATDDKNATPLILAAENGHADVVKLLLEKGANIGARDNQQMTALTHAAKNASVDVVEELLPKSAVKDKNDALLEAAGSGPAWIKVPAGSSRDELKNAQNGTPELTIVKLLLSSGAEIDARAEDGSTPLIRAAEHGQIDTVRLLLEKGASVEATDQNGYSALVAAACECAMATMNDTLEIEKMLLAKRPKIGARDKRGGMALLQAASWGRVWNVKLLLDNGADIESTDEDGNTALLKSCQGSGTSTIDTVRLLLERGAKIEAKNDHGDTALIVAASGSGIDAGAIVQLLLKKGADIRTQDSEGSTALDLATKNGNDAVAQVLAKARARAR